MFSENSVAWSHAVLLFTAWLTISVIMLSGRKPIQARLICTSCILCPLLLSGAQTYTLFTRSCRTAGVSSVSSGYFFALRMNCSMLSAFCSQLFFWILHYAWRRVFHGTSPRNRICTKEGFAEISARPFPKPLHGWSVFRIHLCLSYLAKNAFWELLYKGWFTLPNTLHRLTVHLWPKW